MRLTKAFLEAKLAAIEAENLALRAENIKLQRQLNEAKDLVAVHSRVPQLSFQQLSERAKALAAQGVPCKIQHGHIIHSITKAILV